jgi:hypothetical protein
MAGRRNTVSYAMATSLAAISTTLVRIEILLEQIGDDIVVMRARDAARNIPVRVFEEETSGGRSNRRQPRSIILVAMAPSGETFLARDAEGALLLFPPGRPPEQVDDEVAERAVLAGFVRVDMPFASWVALDQERQRRAGSVVRDFAVDVTTWDVARLRRALPALETWIEQGRTGPARTVLHQLLRAPVVRAQDGLLDEISGLLQSAAGHETPATARIGADRGRDDD